MHHVTNLWFHRTRAASDDAVSVQVGGTHALVHCMQEDFMREGSANILDELKQSFDKSQAIERLQYIQTVRHVFQFSLNPDHDVILWAKQGQLSPKDDGFTFTMKAVMRNLCSRGFEGIITEHCSDSQHLQPIMRAGSANVMDK